MRTTWLVTWNPRKWDWKDLDHDVDAVRRKGYFDDSWNVSSRKVAPGERLFLLKQGNEPRGIIASGRATSKPKERQHHSDPEKMGLYADVSWETILHPVREPILCRARLREPDLVGMHWDTQRSGITIAPPIARKLERVWADFLSARDADRRVKVKTYESIEQESAVDDLSHDPADDPLPDRAKRVVNLIKRNNRVRKDALNRAKGRCEYCKVKGFPMLNGGFYLEAHHIIALCDDGRDTRDNVIALCPDHHRQAHYGKDAESLELEFIRILKKLNRK